LPYSASGRCEFVPLLPTMKTATHPSRLRRALVALLGLSCLISVVRGQTAPAATSSAALLAKYDKNNNGRIDADERDAMSADEKKMADLPVENSSGTKSDIVTLSPFTVDASNDKGYLASNTLSGTRLNSKIQDLGSSITVVTKQQMLDTAVIDINDIFLYESNTEGTGNFTSLTVDRNGGVTDNVQSSPQTANRIRGLDTANTARDNFTSISQIPIDLYNTESVEITRGSNSTLFGLGNASGTVNVNVSKANVTREISNFTLRGDSYGGFRSSIDLNRPIIAGKLAARVSAVYQSTGYERKPSTDETRRQQGALTYKPFSTTTIRANYESYHNYARRPNAVTPRDSVTDWIARGKPTWDPTTQKVTINGVEQPTVYPVSQDANLPLGLFAQGTGFYNRPSIYVDQGAVQFWSVNRTGSVPTTGLFNGIPTPDNPNTNLRFLESANDLQRQRASLFPLYVSPSVTSKSIYDWSSVNFVAPNYFKTKADIYEVQVEQTVLNTQHHLIAAQIGWYREDYDSYSRNFISGTSADLYVDVNQKLLDGSPNPYFLRPYMAASEPTLFNSPVVNDIQAADLAYRLTPSNLPRWLSWINQQSVSAHGETRRIDNATYRFRDAVLDNHTWTNPLNRGGGVTAARGYYKYYVGDNQGQNVDYSAAPIYNLNGRYNLNWFNAATGQWVSEPALIGETGVTPSTRTRREIRTIGFATQNFFWDNRIVTTFGWRQDKNRSRDSNGATIDPTTGFINYDALKIWGPWVEKSGRTKTSGVVVKPFHWLNLSFNKSDSFQPAATAYNLFGELLPNPTGKGKDYGVTISAFHDKLVFKINKYDTFQKNSRSGDAGIVATRAIRMDTGRTANGNDSFNFELWATNLANSRFTAQGIVPTAAQTSAAVATIMGLPQGFLDNLIGKSISETSDISAKGYEFELNYNPKRNLTFKVTAAEQISIDDNLSPSLIDYINTRLPIWTAAKDDAGAFWWKTSIGSGGIPENFYLGNVSAPLKLAIANQGKPRTQVREWRFNGLTKYTFTEGRLKNFDVGGAVRWEDKAAIGFLGAAPDPDGIVRSLDPDKPVYDKARYYFDFLASYNFRLHEDKIRCRVQLNVRNIFENGRLQPVAVNPDGRPYAYRIIDPRQFILSTSFDL
jgi:outer membrane receptor protein involved in Fe transport